MEKIGSITVLPSTQRFMIGIIYSLRVLRGTSYTATPVSLRVGGFVPDDFVFLSFLRSLGGLVGIF